MLALRNQVCQNHPAREAIARCPSCGFFFCRECITEHDERVLCASCLKRQTAKVERPKRSLAPVARAFTACCGFLVAWFFFYIVGRSLLMIPSRFHEGTLWKSEMEKAIDQVQSP
jgi:hypothetical protein